MEYNTYTYYIIINLHLVNEVLKTTSIVDLGVSIREHFAVPVRDGYLSKFSIVHSLIISASRGNPPVYIERAAAGLEESTADVKSDADVDVQ